MTYQQPTKKAYNQDDVKLKIYMNETYPAIAVKAKKESAEIYWGDETGINSQEYRIRGFTPKGMTPTVPSLSKIEKINMISAITNNGVCRFKCYEDNVTQQRFIEFVARLIRDVERKVLFIVDNLRVHHGKLVQAWLGNRKAQIEVFYTAPYSPESKPDEYLNHNLKQGVHSGNLPHNKADLKAKPIALCESSRSILLGDETVSSQKFEVHSAMQLLNAVSIFSSRGNNTQRCSYIAQL